MLVSAMLGLVAVLVWFFGYIFLLFLTFFPNFIVLFLYLLFLSILFVCFWLLALQFFSLPSLFALAPLYFLGL